MYFRQFVFSYHNYQVMFELCSLIMEKLGYSAPIVSSRTDSHISNNPMEISFRENIALIKNDSNELLLSGTTSPKQHRPSIPHETPPIVVSLQDPEKPVKNDRYGSPVAFDLSQLQSAEFGGTLLATQTPEKDFN